MRDIFISYSREDKGYARKLREKLEKEGLAAWMDDEIDYGAQWSDVLEEHIDECSAFILIMTPRSRDSQWVQNELARAQRKGKRVFPLLLEGEEPWLTVEAIQYVDVRNGNLPPPGFYDQLGRAAGMPEASLATPEGGEERLPRLPEVPCPYRGLEPFEAEHAEFYFGRVDMVQQLVAKVKELAFVAVVGPSGCGKSSLVRAGLTPSLLSEGERGWTVRFFRPGMDPLRAFSAELVALLEPGASEVNLITETRKLADSLRAGLPASDVTARLVHKYPELSRIVLVADQFEELYTECPDEEAWRSFVRTLLAASRQGIKIVLTLRADFLGRALSNRQLGEAIDAGLVTVLPMSDDDLRAAVTQPALRLERSFEPGLVERIVQDVAGAPGNLPLLEFALTELWARQSADGLLTHSAYEAIGMVEGAVARYADQVHSGLSAAEQQNARRAFLQMVRPGEGVEDTRRQAHRTELDEDAWELVRRLADLRLVVTGQDKSTGQETAEVVHEALIQHWGRLRNWIDEDRDFRIWQERLRTSLEEWETSDRDAGALLRGTPLIVAQDWLKKRASDLNEQERTFVGESLALRERDRRAKRLRNYGLLGMAAVIAALVLVLILIGLRAARITAEDAVATARANQITAVAEARAAVKARDTAEAEARAARGTAVAEARARATAESRVEALATRATATAEALAALATTEAEATATATAEALATATAEALATAEAEATATAIAEAPATPTVEVTATPECSSYRPPLIGKADLPGEVEILTPANCTTGLPTETSIQVVGSDRGIPDNVDLWVLVYPPNMLYYPISPDACQGGPPARSGGKWQVPLFLGSRGGEPEWFDIVAILADQEASQLLGEWLREACRTGDWQEIQAGQLETLNIMEKAYITVQTRD